ncbi:hypothetical protein CTAYLR_000641 [Chrysophaeum taylorii]|uniref:Calcineurin-like phosphoesterase domain-containing protein n=1 Tax=Chrysophaeum taylorii TaxID=2483200 RepID=A0AAD7UAQ6_9STRA|nr:hypothetical protein CTAYLR_000641 [Chrysophaeum taylorii]
MRVIVLLAQHVGGVRVGSVARFSRIVAVGDVHGDLRALRACLRVAGVVDRDGGWATDHALVVSTGDVLDGGGEDWKCLKYLRSLQETARRQGGDVVLTLGNHECLNLQGNLASVAPQGFLDVESDVGSRRAAFLPGGPGALLLNDLCAGSPVARIVGDTLFCHGGVHVDFLDRHRPEAASYREVLSSVNAKACDWLVGRRVDTLADGTPRILDFRSPAWLRLYSNPPNAEPSKRHCDAARHALRALGCNRMVVGHTPQFSADSCCGDRVYRIDTGAHYGGPKEALELRKGLEPRVRSAAIRSNL